MKSLLRRVWTIFWITPLVAAFGTPGVWSDPGASTAPLQQAHEAYLVGDMRKMAATIREVLQNGDATSQANALSLLEEAYKSPLGGNIPADWTLPKSLSGVQFAVRHYGGPSGENYSIKLSGVSTGKGVIKQLQVMHYPNRVVLDLEGKVGKFAENPETDGWYFELEAERTNQPAAEGLYLLNVRLTNGESAQGWFVLSNLASSQSPNVQVPRVGQTFSSGNPTMKWEDFYSPEYNGREQRALYVEVAKSEPPTYDWQSVWHLHESDPSRTEITIGKSGNGVNRLNDGRYVFVVTYSESRKFGDLLLSRRSIALTPFHIKAK